MRKLALLLVAACSGAPRAARPPPGPTPPPENLDRGAAAADLAASVRDSYRLLGGGYDNVYLETLAHDQGLVLFGVGPGDLLVGYGARAATIGRLFPDEEYDLRSKDLEVHVAADGCCAWVHDDLSYRVTRGNRRAAIPLRTTAVHERRDGRWVKVQEHISYAVPDDEAAARAAHLAAELPAFTSPGEAGAHVRDLLLARIADRPEARASAVLDPDAFALGPQPERELRGAAIADAPTVRALVGAERIEPLALRVNLSATGTVAWAAATLRIVAPAGTYDARATWVLEKRPPADFQVVQTHVSVPVPAEAIARTLLGPE